MGTTHFVFRVQSAQFSGVAAGAESELVPALHGPSLRESREKHIPTEHAATGRDLPQCLTLVRTKRSDKLYVRISIHSIWDEIIH